MTNSEHLLAVVPILQRPAMYVGKKDLRLLLCFLDGWNFALSGCGGHGPLYHWSDFIHFKYGVNHPWWGVDRILYHFHDHNDIKAVDSLPPLFVEFMKGGSKWPEPKEGQAPDCALCETYYD